MTAVSPVTPAVMLATMTAVILTAVMSAERMAMVEA